MTRASSKQTYYTARLLVDRELVNDFYRAYAYFRWADDVIDETPHSDTERSAFIKRQKALIDGLYQQERTSELSPEEEMLADLIRHDREENSKLQSFIRNMFAVIAFDAKRKGRLISRQELSWYTSCLARSVTDGLQHFIGHHHPYPHTGNRLMAATAAHITHLLRDMVVDTAHGFINIPQQTLAAHSISPADMESDPFRAWVRQRVGLARQAFREGKQYLAGLEVWRCKLAGYWYCARFEGILDAIERDGYLLRASYPEQRSFSAWLTVIRIGISVTVRHFLSRYNPRRIRQDTADDGNGR
ncbi:MAG: squalene/phytoene synthase family protein [Trueperaceae bacterium]|nr:MAG: squalene/phytoene synthase family protein [Trueperaceae bacterium]